MTSMTFTEPALDEEHMMSWFRETLQPFSSLVQVTDLESSWQTGLALCALVQVYRPHLLSVAPPFIFSLLFNKANKQFAGVSCLLVAEVERMYNASPV